LFSFFFPKKKNSKNSLTRKEIIPFEIQLTELFRVRMELNSCDYHKVPPIFQIDLKIDRIQNFLQYHRRLLLLFQFHHFFEAYASIKTLLFQIIKLQIES